MHVYVQSQGACIYRELTVIISHGGIPLNQQIDQTEERLNQRVDKIDQVS